MQHDIIIFMVTIIVFIMCTPADTTEGVGGGYNYKNYKYYSILLRHPLHDYKQFLSHCTSWGHFQHQLVMHPSTLHKVLFTRPLSLRTSYVRMSSQELRAAVCTHPFHMNTCHKRATHSTQCSLVDTVLVMYKTIQNFVLCNTH